MAYVDFSEKESIFFLCARFTQQILLIEKKNYRKKFVDKMKMENAPVS